MRKRKAVQVY